VGCGGWKRRRVQTIGVSLPSLSPGSRLQETVSDVAQHLNNLELTVAKMEGRSGEAHDLSSCLYRMPSLLVASCKYFINIQFLFLRIFDMGASAV
jgi:hypothetical protein